ncbi:serine/threonine-protein phosphatase 7 long form homolog [Arachis hypogaea]|uniref:serine/threonine-protein phosphatase 7 long form homolog n=1 Tax=Arachis hypogaea TaxID=3818 RepID=UPI003B20DF21
MTVHFTWFHERFSVLPPDVNEETVRIYARAYIMMHLSTQLFGDKSANQVHIRRLPFVANLDDMGRYSWGSAALAWLYRCCLLTYLRTMTRNRRVLSYQLALDRLTARDVSITLVMVSFVVAFRVVTTYILVMEHSRIWRAVTTLIYFAVIEWHQVDRVVPQLGGVQHIPEDALNIDWLHAKDGRRGDRWFPHYYQAWHLHWGNRIDAVIAIERVADPGPSADYLDW